DGSGVEVAQEIRRWSELPILVLSAVGDEREKVRALDAGADDYITKPFGSDELTARLRALLRRSADGASTPVVEAGDLRVDLASPLDEISTRDRAILIPAGRPRADAPSMARVVERGLRRTVGVPGLFATAYGNVGSSIYYALGLVAAHALGLTPLVFILAGGLFALTAKTYAEGAAMFPEAGGRAAVARRAFREVAPFLPGR